MLGNWRFNRNDEEVLKDMIEFIPENVLDAHAHIYRVKDLDSPSPALLSQGPDEAGIDVWRESMVKMLGNSPQKALFMPFPAVNCNIDAANNYLVEQLAYFSDASGTSTTGREKNLLPEYNRSIGTLHKCKGLILVAPGYVKEQALKHLKNPQIAGFKPYHVFSEHSPSFDSDIDAFVPEWVWETANERSLVIMLHIVKDGALNDAENQKQIREKCMRYPAMKLILAHAGRGFQVETVA